ncbi:hypothetical protein ACQ4PT_037233 [Festuca glaucescens]
MAGKTPAPPPNLPMRQSVPPRSTPGCGEDRSNVGVFGGGADSSVGAEGQGDRQSRFEPSNNSNQGGRNSDWRGDGFNAQGFGGFEEGYYEGNNGYGNGYGSMNRADATQLGASASRELDATTNTQNMDSSSIENLVIPLSIRAQNKIDKKQCLRCGENGHLADACETTLCLYCEKTSHESKSCPLLSMPKPVVVTYGVCRNELMFHEIPASSELTFKHDSGKVGKISVTGGSLTPQEIVHELEWIIPRNHQWDLRPTKDVAFKVLFPSKADLARMSKIINVPVPETTMFLHFEEWSAIDVDMFYLTEEVDMEFTRAYLVVRMKVEVTWVENIPTTTVDHTYDGQRYGLIFKLEARQGKEKTDVVMQDANLGDDLKNAEGKDKEVLKGDDSSMGGLAKSSSAPNPVIPKPTNVPSKQAHDLSAPVLRVGLIDCYESLKSGFVSRSASRTADLMPRRLWGDSDN